MYLNNLFSTKLQRSVNQKYSRYHMTPHNRVGLHKIQHAPSFHVNYKADENY
jgi:hypothetical protein